jgi:hypothetical protein
MRSSNTTGATGQIVVGIDGSGDAVRGAVWAAAEGARHGVPLRLVHRYYQPYDETSARRAHLVAVHAWYEVPDARPALTAIR